MCVCGCNCARLNNECVCLFVRPVWVSVPVYACARGRVCLCVGCARAYVCVCLHMRERERERESFKTAKDQFAIFFKCNQGTRAQIAMTEGNERL